MSIELVRTDDFQEDKKDERIPSYAQFLWADEVNHREVYLISNKPVIKITDRHNGMLFETEHVELLIPERPKVDYFFQLYGQFEIDEIKEMDTILNTTVGIGLAEHIDTSALKSFVNLMH